MSNGNRYAPTGAPPPQQGGYQAPQGPPQGQGGYQAPQGPPQGQGGYQPPQGPSQGQGGYQAPQGPPQGQGGYQAGSPFPDPNGGLDQLPPGMRGAIEREMKQAGGGDRVDYDEIVYYKPNQPKSVGETADSVVRILPGWLGDDQPFWHKEWRHFVSVTLKDGRRMRLPRLCPAKNAAERGEERACPICERYERAKAAGDKELATTLKARSRYYVNVLDYEHLDSHQMVDKKTGQPVLRAKVWGMGQGLFQKIGRILGSKGLVYDRNVGRYLKIWATKIGPESRDVRYDMIDGSDPCPLPQGYENIELMPLDSLDSEKSYADMADEIRETYPDVGGPQAGGAPPYQNPYQAPPQAQGGYQAPPQAQGGYQAPPQAQGGYQAPPQAQGGYQAPPQAQGGYQAPPQAQGGYQAPPQVQGGYQAPQASQAPPQGQGGYQAPQAPPQGQGGYQAPQALPQVQGGYQASQASQAPPQGQGGYQPPQGPPQGQGDYQASQAPQASQASPQGQGGYQAPQGGADPVDDLPF